MNRRGFLKWTGMAGLAPLAAIGRPGRARAAVDGRPLPKTKEEVYERLAEIEREVGVGPEGIRSYCPDTGLIYKTLAWDHLGDPRKPEGKAAIHFPTKESAWALWFAAFQEYRSTRYGKIYWRKRPAIQEVFDWPDGYWKPKKHAGYLVWARLVIDDWQETPYTP